MNRSHGPWTINHSLTVYENGFVIVQEDQVIKPDGQPGAYSTVDLGTGVSLLPVDEQQNVYLVRQFRYAVGEETLEAVSGSIERDESPLQAARREAKEEIGLKAAEWTWLGVYYPDTSIIKNPVHLFIGQGLHFESPDRDGAEKTMEPVKMPLAEAVANVLQGEIRHALSGLLILKADAILSQ